MIINKMMKKKNSCWREKTLDRWDNKFMVKMVHNGAIMRSLD